MNKEKIYKNLESYRGHILMEWNRGNGLLRKIFFLERFDKNKNPILKTNFNEKINLELIGGYESIVSLNKYNLLKNST